MRMVPKIISRERFEHELTRLAFKNIVRGPTLSEKKKTSLYVRWTYKARYLPRLSLQNTAFSHERAMSRFRPQFPRSTHGTPGAKTHTLGNKEWLTFYDSNYHTESWVIISLLFSVHYSQVSFLWPFKLARITSSREVPHKVAAC